MKRTLLALLLSVALVACGDGAPEVVATASDSPATSPSPAAAPSPQPVPDPVDSPTPQPQPDPAPTSDPEPEPEPEPEPAPDPKTVQVDIVDFGFEPDTMSINVGDTVAWTHVGRVLHTVTFSGDGPDSGDMNEGDAFDVTFDQPGTYSYRCIYHGQMTGTITVG